MVFREESNNVIGLQDEEQISQPAAFEGGNRCPEADLLWLWFWCRWFESPILLWTTPCPFSPCLSIIIRYLMCRLSYGSTKYSCSSSLLSPEYLCRSRVRSSIGSGHGRFTPRRSTIIRPPRPLRRRYRRWSGYGTSSGGEA